MYSLNTSFMFFAVSFILWVLVMLFLKLKNKNSVVVLMIISVFFVICPIKTEIKNYMVFPLLGGFFVGEMFLNWWNKLKQKINPPEISKPLKPSKLSIKGYKVDESEIKQDKHSESEHIIVSDEQLKSRQRIKKRYEE